MTERNTHLLDWLSDGYTHCQHGTKEWCEGYLHNARDVIKAQDDHIASLAAELAELRAGSIRFAVANATLEADLAEARVALEPFAAFAEKAGRFVQGRADFGGSPIMPTKHFRLADFQRAARARSGEAAAMTSNEPDENGPRDTSTGNTGPDNDSGLTSV